jgi:hypothetical protein
LHLLVQVGELLQSYSEADPDGFLQRVRSAVAAAGTQKGTKK